MERGGTITTIGRDGNGLGLPLACLSEDAISHPIKPLIQCLAAGPYKLLLSCVFALRFNTRSFAVDAHTADHEA